MAGCKFLRSYEEIFSEEAKNVLSIFLGGVYNCPYCKTFHKIPYRRTDKNETKA